LKDKMRKYPVNPLYPALERLPFSGFQSSPIADRKRQCNPVRYPKPCKRQTAPAAGHGWQLPQWTTGSPDIYQMPSVGCVPSPPAVLSRGKYKMIILRKCKNQSRVEGRLPMRNLMTCLQARRLVPLFGEKRGPKGPRPSFRITDRPVKA